MIKSVPDFRARVRVFLSLQLVLSLCLSLVFVTSVSATETAGSEDLTVPAPAAGLTGPWLESFESYGSSQTGYTSPVGASPTAAQPWTTVTGGSAGWSVGEEPASGSAEANHFLQQTDPTSGTSYLIANGYWGTDNPVLTDGSITLSGRVKVTGANSTYAGLAAKYSVSGTKPTYYRFMTKKNSVSYQFYLERVTGTSKTAVPQTPGSPNASGVSVPNTVLNPFFDSQGYLPLKLDVIHREDGSLKLDGYYGGTLVLSGTDVSPLTAGGVGLYSQSGTTAFDDIQAAAYTGGGPGQPGVPSAPAGVSASPSGAGAVKLTWTAVPSAAGYKVNMSANAGGPFTTLNASPVTATEYTAAGLTPGQTYYFTVSAVNASGESAASAPVSAVPLASAKPPVTTTAELLTRLNAAVPGEVIELADGSYTGFTVRSRNGTAQNPIVVKAQHKGKAVFASTGLTVETSSYITIQDMEFRMNPQDKWINLNGSNNIRITNNYFHSQNTTTAADKSNWIYIKGTNSHHNRIDHNLMENKRDRGKFILFDGVSSRPEGSIIPYEITRYDTVEYNVFRNTLERQSNESEPIRIGVSVLSGLDAHATIQYNVFDHCDSDTEIVSVKSGANTIRYNYFVESLGSVTLRTGSGSSVYGNMFIGKGRQVTSTDPDDAPLGTGGVRVYGENHKVYNNYFEGLTGTNWDATLAFTTGDNDNMTGPIDPTNNHYIAKNIVIANNTLVNNKSGIELGMVRYGTAPKNLTFANNIVVGSQDELIRIMTPIPGLTWSGNIMFPQKGVSLVTGNSAPLTEGEVKVVYPSMQNATLELGPQDYPWLWASSEYEPLRHIAYKKLAADSPAIDASKGNYASGGPLSFVTEDMDREVRSGIPDVGADEYTPDGRTDAEAPAWPSPNPLTTDSLTPRTVKLKWAAAADDTGITGYRIYRSGVLIDTVFGDVLSYEAGSLQPGTAYTFKIEALDRADHKTAGNTVSVTTPAFTGISLTGVPAQLALGGVPKQLAVVAHYSDGSAEPVPSGAVFTSSQPGVLAVSAEGRLTPAGLGMSSVSAAYGGTTAPAVVYTVRSSSTNPFAIGGDTYVDNILSDKAGTNFSTEPEMQIKRKSASRRNGYIKAALPALAQPVDSVQLKLFVTSAQSGSDLQLTGILNDDWNPAEVTANNQPARSYSDIPLGSKTPLADGSYVIFDVTEFYNTPQAAQDGVLSFRLSMNENDREARIASLEGTDPAKAPVLLITTVNP
ncbi:chondroitinase-B domain-containing protein [Paenibacillus chitinolyticus]|uniref:chondroitinase-B domain-containing protein n=1 Tax=Paenibacillus chitinolyticus TaxID=79263 RepID=UPI00366BBDB7